MSQANLAAVDGVTPDGKQARTAELYEEYLAANYRRTSRVFTGLMIGQWLFGILIAVVWSPYGWEGAARTVHLHVYTAVFLGAALSGLPILLTIVSPSAASTRYVVAIAQMLWSALLIHLTGGRIETHFHVFGSLAFLAFYRDWRVLVPATLVVASDHLLRGAFWPESVYGISNPEWWRFLEHALWVVFEDVVLVLACVRGTQETRLVATRQAEAEESLSRVNELNEELDQRVNERTFQLSETNVQLRESLGNLGQAQRQLVEASRRAGMADVATTVLHNVGNVLNSINVSSGVIAQTVRGSKIGGVAKVRDVLAQDDVAPLLASHPKGQQLGTYLGRLSEALLVEQGTVVEELDGLQRNIEHIKVIVSTQLTHAKNPGGMLETLSLRTLAQDALKMSGLAQMDQRVEVVCELADVASTLLDRHKVFQIIMNLLSNARHAVTQTGRNGRIILRLRQDGDAVVRLEIEDTGCGIAAENLNRIFNHGFTTKQGGHGFGLHSSACAAMEMGGRLFARSDGPGRGATFTLELPLNSMQAAA
jgi:signal transduction histidine kinase